MLTQRPSPIYLTVAALILGVACIGLSLTAAILAFRQGSWGPALLFVALLLFSIWALIALSIASVTPGQGLGSRLSLSGFLVGSLLALFRSPVDVLTGSISEPTAWQGVCWLAGAALVVVGLEKDRRQPTQVPPRPAVLPDDAELAR